MDKIIMEMNEDVGSTFDDDEGIEIQKIISD
jgi:hypothetical protein